MPLQELDPNICDLKRRKGKNDHTQTTDGKKQMDGKVAMAAEQHRQPNECYSLELPGIGVLPSGLDTYRGGESKRATSGLPIEDEGRSEQNQGHSK